MGGPERMGLPANQFAGHSFWIGEATAAAQAGLEDCISGSGPLVQCRIYSVYPYAKGAARSIVSTHNFCLFIIVFFVFFMTHVWTDDVNPFLLIPLVLPILYYTSTLQLWVDWGSNMYVAPTFGPGLSPHLYVGSLPVILPKLKGL